MAQAASELGVPAFGAIPNAAYPTAGQGLVLDSNGKLPQAILQQLPGYRFARTQFTSNVTTTATTEATATTVVTLPSITFDGNTTVKIEFYAPNADCDTANRNINFSLFDAVNGAAAASVGIFAGTNIVWTGGGTLLLGFYELTPSATAHVYSVRVWIGGGAATVHVDAGIGGAGTNVPGYVSITRV